MRLLNIRLQLWSCAKPQKNFKRRGIGKSELKDGQIAILHLNGLVRVGLLVNPLGCSLDPAHSGTPVGEKRADISIGLEVSTISSSIFPQLELA